jgi:hypothetical protein
VVTVGDESGEARGGRSDRVGSRNADGIEALCPCFCDQPCLGPRRVV